MTQDTNSTFGTRLETDSLGTAQIPSDAYWGISTWRAVNNFPISGRPIGSLRDLVWALGAVKIAAARSNEAAGLLSAEHSHAIQQAAEEVMNGVFDDQFVVDRIQGGAGTSTNMNANEVIANRALEIMGARRGDYHQLNPIDHVNRSQSTNDTYPTALKITLLRSLERHMDEHQRLIEAFAAKGREFNSILKVGRPLS